MPWWGWIILGAVLLGSELMVVDAAFYLVFLGIAAAITGLTVLFGIVMEPWLQWLMFGSLSLITMMTFRGRVYDKIRGNVADYAEGPVGQVLRLESDLAAGAQCRQEFRGSTWMVINRSTADISAGTEVRISEVSGLNLIVHNMPQHSKQE
ncbi:MAG: NfeD family protein [Gammaproteobacteria bacterium]|nr:NfeD family protein [Gammaproteobacteria bacterium]